MTVITNQDHNVYTFRFAPFPSLQMRTSIFISQAQHIKKLHFVVSPTLAVEQSAVRRVSNTIAL